MFRINERVFDVAHKNSYYHSPSARTKKCLPHVLGTGHYICNKNYIIDREGYHCYMLLLTLNGRGILVYKGKEYDLTPGSLFFIDCRDRHMYRTIQDQWEIKWLHLNGGGCSGYYNYINQTFGPILFLNDTSVLETYLDTLRELLEHKNFQFDIDAALLISQILTTCIHPFYNPQESFFPQRSLSIQKSFDTVISYIESNHAKSISLEELAALTGYSKYHFLRIFKIYTGSTPYEYLLQYKLNLSKELLQHTQYSIETIAEKTGFNSPSNYIKLFKKHETLTPLQYRKMVEGE